MIDVADGFMMMAERAFKQRDALAEALEQIRTVCIDNAGDTVRHDLALKFVGDVAARTLAKHVTSTHSRPTREAPHD